MNENWIHLQNNHYTAESNESRSNRRQNFGLYLLIHLSSSVLRVSEGLIHRLKSFWGFNSSTQSIMWSTCQEFFFSLYFNWTTTKASSFSLQGLPRFIYIVGLVRATHVKTSKWCIFFYIYIDFNYLIKIIGRYFFYIYFMVEFEYILFHKNYIYPFSHYSYSSN